MQDNITPALARFSQFIAQKNKENETRILQQKGMEIGSMLASQLSQAKTLDDLNKTYSDNLQKVSQLGNPIAYQTYIQQSNIIHQNTVQAIKEQQTANVQSQMFNITNEGIGNPYVSENGKISPLQDTHFYKNVLPSLDPSIRAKALEDYTNRNKLQTDTNIEGNVKDGYSATAMLKDKNGNVVSEKRYKITYDKATGPRFDDLTTQADENLTAGQIQGGADLSNEFTKQYNKDRQDQIKEDRLIARMNAQRESNPSLQLKYFEDKNGNKLTLLFNPKDSKHPLIDDTGKSYSLEGLTKASYSEVDPNKQLKSNEQTRNYYESNVKEAANKVLASIMANKESGGINDAGKLGGKIGQMKYANIGGDAILEAIQSQNPELLNKFLDNIAPEEKTVITKQLDTYNERKKILDNYNPGGQIAW